MERKKGGEKEEEKFTLNLMRKQGRKINLIEKKSEPERGNFPFKIFRTRAECGVSGRKFILIMSASYNFFFVSCQTQYKRRNLLIFR